MQGRRGNCFQTPSPIIEIPRVPDKNFFFAMGKTGTSQISDAKHYSTLCLFVSGTLQLTDKDPYTKHNEDSGMDRLAPSGVPWTFSLWSLSTSARATTFDF
jgi:hypothetical protein